MSRRRPATIALHKRSRSVPDHWDTRPENLFNPPDEPPDLVPDGHDDPTNEVKLRDSSGRLRLPAYILIALGIALAALLVMAAGLLLAPGVAPSGTGGGLGRPAV
jgi:hypothetical protein